MTTEIVDKNSAILHFPGVEDFFCDRKSCRNVVELMKELLSCEKGGALFIHGPSGCGKTHLIKGFLNDYKKQKPDSTTLFVTAQQLLETLSGSTGEVSTEIVKSEYCGYNVLVIEDLFTLSGNLNYQHYVAKLTRCIVDEGGIVIFASDLTPRSYPSLISYLKESIHGFTLTDMSFPGDKCRQLFISNFSNKLGISISQEESGRILRRCKGIGSIRSALTASKFASTYNSSENK